MLSHRDDICHFCLFHPSPPLPPSFPKEVVVYDGEESSVDGGHRLQRHGNEEGGIVAVAEVVAAADPKHALVDDNKELALQVRRVGNFFPPSS